MKKQRPSLLGDAIVGAELAIATQEPPLPKGDENHLRTTVYFHRNVYDKLREIAYQERTSMGKLVHEGLDVVLERRNFPSTGELKRQ